MRSLVCPSVPPTPRFFRLFRAQRAVQYSTRSTMRQNANERATRNQRDAKAAAGKRPSQLKPALQHGPSIERRNEQRYSTEEEANKVL